MATPGFGFSVGDVLAGLHVVRKLIRALNDTGGSRAAYQKLISELLNLEDALRGVNELQVDPTQAAQKLALEQVAQQCQKSIEDFLIRNAKFKDSLGARPSTMSAWRLNLYKVQWALCKESEIEALRTEISAHSTTLNLIMSTVQLSATRLQSHRIDGYIYNANTARIDSEETKALVKHNKELLHTLIETISSNSSNLYSQQQTTDLQTLMQKVLEANMRTFNTVVQIQQLQSQLPPQITRQQPIIFEDAHERLTPFHLEFINSFAAFQAVLEVRFSEVPGLKKVKSLEYAIQDTASKKSLDISKPWESIFRPGRKVIMSMLFEQVETTISSCPACFRDSVQKKDDENTHTQCPNPACGLWYCRVTEVRSKKRSRTRQEAKDSVKRRKLNVEVDNFDEQGEESDDEDEISDFRRVQIVQGNPPQQIRPTPVLNVNDVSGQPTSPSSNEQDAHSFSQGTSERPQPPISDTETIEISPNQTPSQEQITTFASTDVNIERPIKFAVPKSDRTMNDIFSDELYNANFEANTSSSSRFNEASIPAPSDLFAQRLQAAKEHHSIPRSNPSFSTPFKAGSPLTPLHETSFLQPSDERYVSLDLMAENPPFVDESPGISGYDYGTFESYVSPSGY